MGKPKKGANSARTRKSAAYKARGQREINKAKKQEKIAAGKKIKSKKQPKTMDMIRDTMVRNVINGFNPNTATKHKDKKGNEFILTPKNVNKTCVR